jgi:Xaa-Pro aminopeptidase
MARWERRFRISLNALGSRRTCDPVEETRGGGSLFFGEMSLPFVIEALLVARRARRDGAFERVREWRIDVRNAESTRDAIALSLQRTTMLQAERVARLSAMAGASAASSPDDARAAAHIAMLDARAQEMRSELSRAEHTVTAARTKLEREIAEFMRAQKQLDAALEQKAQWEREIENGELRAQDNFAGDRIVSRFANRR